MERLGLALYIIVPFAVGIAAGRQVRKWAVDRVKDIGLRVLLGLAVTAVATAGLGFAAYAWVVQLGDSGGLEPAPPARTPDRKARLGRWDIEPTVG